MLLLFIYLELNLFEFRITFILNIFVLNIILVEKYSAFSHTY